MFMYCVVEPMEPGIVADAPVLLVTLNVSYPAVDEADACVIAHPLPALVEVANIANTLSPDIAPVTAQSIETVVDAATVKEGAMSVQVPAIMVLSAVPEVPIFTVELNIAATSDSKSPPVSDTRRKPPERQVIFEHEVEPNDWE